jgi:hypothetical protein
MFDVLKAQKRRPAMKKISTMQAFSNEILKEQKLTIGVDLGDRWSFYCVLDEAGKIILEQKVATTPEAMKQTFGKIPRSLMALETGTHMAITLPYGPVMGSMESGLKPRKEKSPASMPVDFLPFNMWKVVSDGTSTPD